MYFPFAVLKGSCPSLHVAVAFIRISLAEGGHRHRLLVADVGADEVG